MARTPENQGIFFELDGVLVRDVLLHGDDRPLSYFPGALEQLARIDPRRFHLFVASNREDIAFGQLRERDFRAFCTRLLADAHDAGISIRKIYTCPYHPRARPRYRKDSVFRKPAPGMFKMAQQEFDLNLHRSWMIGHTTTDILAGSRAGLGTILVQTGAGGSDGAFVVDPHFIEPDLEGAVNRIVSFEMALRR